MKDPENVTVFIAGDAAEGVGNELIESIRKTGRRSKLVDKNADTDHLLSEEFKQMMEDEREIKETAVVTIHKLDRVEEITPLINESSLLILALTSGRTDRKIVKRLTEVIDPSRIGVIIRSEA